MSRSKQMGSDGLLPALRGGGIWAGLTCGAMAMLCVVLGSCGNPRHEQPGVQQSLPGPAATQLDNAKWLAQLRTTSFGPLTNFDNSCARCHGPYGSFYGPDFGKKLDTAALRKVIDDMASGPGGAPLNESELDQQTAYHQSLIDGKPFINLMHAEITDGILTLSGEVTPDAKVYVPTGQDPREATVQGHHWTAQYPAKGLWYPLSLLAKTDGQATEIHPEKTAWSHQVPDK